MSDFDRSGSTPATDGGVYYFAELDPFTQGYVEAMLGDPIDVSVNLDPPAQMGVLCGFRHLAPETIAAILKDCDEAFHPETEHTAENGAKFWDDQQAGKHHLSLPPLTPYLGDDGRVYLREAS